VILGKVWRGRYEGNYLIFIDLDNLKAIDEFCSILNNQTLQEIAQKFIIEQHKDNLSKAHMLFYSRIQFAKKDSDMIHLDDYGKQKLLNNELPAFEIKGDGPHGVVFCTPSIHKHGQHYEIIGTTEPVLIDGESALKMMQQLDEVCKKYNLQYLQRASKSGNGSAHMPMSDVYNIDLKTPEGHNRHLREIRLMASLILKHRKDMPLEQIKRVAWTFNQLNNVPPKESEQFESDWEDALEFVERKDEEKAAAESGEEFLEGCLVMELINRSPETYVVATKKDDYHNPTTGIIHPLRVIQQVKVVRSRDDKGNEKTPEYHYGQFIVNAIPVRPIEVIYDPLFDITKYRMRWEYVGAGHQVMETDEPVGPLTKEELEEWLISQDWVYREKGLSDALSQVIKGYKTRKGMATFSIEIETEGLIWLTKENRLVLSKIERRKPSPKEAMSCCKLLLELQQKFYQPTTKRPDERRRFAHFTKIGLVAPVDFARRQCGAVEAHGIIPRQDLGGRSHVGKTKGYAGLALRLYRLPMQGKSKYVIGAGSVETESRLIRCTKVTTMPVILDDADFFTDWQKNDQAKRCLSIMKYASDNTNPRDILTQDLRSLDLPLCAYTMITHNSDLIDEDGWITRCMGHEFTNDDRKTVQEEELYQAFMEKHAYVIGFLGDFAIDYYLTHSPHILFNDWHTIAKTILKEFFMYAGYKEDEIPRWFLEEIVTSATSQDKLAEDRSAKISAAFHDIIQNHGWVRNKRETAIWIAKFSRKKIPFNEFNYETDEARREIDHVMATATMEEKVRALIEINALPMFRWHETYGVCTTAPIIDELKKHGITRVSHTQLPSYCDNFRYSEGIYFPKKTRAVYASLADFVTFINPTKGQQ
jgi:hypothetical protein